ncbi:hypothetical protein IEQ34_010112 [Dendrobium chrysotoxum]|uniref:Uncharacterized protein n=1 Tax=Dendrobium chrysotoxum TaxID=161865 RepID=A0AAV7H0Y0_DENCH|nr:hypothetical protein IEQ34_010112 [Dendrobium chrysotoxum]
MAWYRRSEIFPSAVRFLNRGRKGFNTGSVGQKAVMPLPTLEAKESPASLVEWRSSAKVLQPFLDMRSVMLRSAVMGG